MSRNAQTIDAKTPDRFLETVGIISDWIAKNVVAVISVIGLALVAGAAWATWSFVSTSKETALQERYFVIEKKLMDTRRKFDEAEQAALAAAQAKPGQPAPPAAVGVKASGDLAKDFGTQPEELSAFINENPKSRAGEMAALNLADLQVRYKQPDAAMATLGHVNTNNRTSDLTGALIVSMRGTLAADKGDCQTAVGLWQKLVDEKSANFLHQDVKLRMGICYEKMNDLAKAEQMYGQAAEKVGAAPENQTGKDADRYLRLLKMKKASGS